MRRIIENYFKLLGKYGDDDLFIKAQENTMEKYLRVFKGVFEKTDNLGHFNMMMGSEND